MDTKETGFAIVRPSELVDSFEGLLDTKKIELNDDEQTLLADFEKKLFDELKEIKEISVSTHLIYPKAFEGKKGNKLFAMIYESPDLLEVVSESLKKGEIKKISEKKQIYKALFEDLQEISKSDEQSNLILSDGVLLSRTSGEIASLTGKEENLVGKMENGFNEKENISNRFSEVDLKKVPVQLRKAANGYASGWAKKEFVEDFRKNGGNVDLVDNPERACRVVDLDKLEEKMASLRKFKRNLKGMERTEDDSNNLGKAKLAMLKIYREYVNTLIVDEYENGRLLKNESNKDRANEVLELFRGNLRGNDFRVMEKLDHFIAGSGLRVGDDGLFESVPDKLSKYIHSRMQLEVEHNEKYEKYNTVTVDADTAKKLIESVLKVYGFDSGEKPWKVEVMKGKDSLAVIKGKRTIRIPESFSRGLIDTLGVIAHEIEGHVLRIENQENGELGMKLVDEMSSGRGGILSEAASMSIEDRTKKMMVGEARLANPYYYLILEEKNRGGSFKDCFEVFARKYVETNYKMSLEDIMQDSEKYNDLFKYVYDRTLRIFRKNTPLDDSSGFLPATDQLEYIEQELVVEKLENLGLSKLLYFNGLDLFSIKELLKLGVVDLDKIREPEMVTANVIWPIVKQFVDDGLDSSEWVLKTKAVQQ